MDSAGGVEGECADVAAFDEDVAREAAAHDGGPLTGVGATDHDAVAVAKGGDAFSGHSDVADLGGRVEGVGCRALFAVTRQGSAGICRASARCGRWWL